MALGDLVYTKQHVPDLLYRKATGGYTPVPGQPVYFVKTTGDIQLATASTDDGPVYIVSNLTHVIDGVTYYGVCISGYIVTTAGGVIYPGNLVAVNATSKWIAIAEAATATAANNADVLFKGGHLYIGLESDNQYAQTVSADTNPIVVKVGGR